MNTELKPWTMVEGLITEYKDISNGYIYALKNNGNKKKDMLQEHLKPKKDYNKYSKDEQNIIIDNYKTHSVNELSNLLPGKTEKSIKCKVEHLQKLGKLGKKNNTRNEKVIVKHPNNGLLFNDWVNRHNIFSVKDFMDENPSIEKDKANELFDYYQHNKVIEHVDGRNYRKTNLKEG